MRRIAAVRACLSVDAFVHACARAFVCAAATGFAGTALAHESAEAGLPAAPGVVLDAAIALAAADASSAAAWPAARVPGWMTQPAEDRRHRLFEQASLGAGWRLNEQLGVRLAVGAHPGGPAHVETAVVDWRSPAAPADGARWSARLGRRSVPLGAVVDAAGAFDDFTLAPLAKRLMLDDDWIDEGLDLGWAREETPAGLTGASFGVWRARAYPGGRSGPPAATLRFSGRFGDWDAALAAAALQPRDRGLPVASTTLGHSHDLPDCHSSLAGLVCYRGHSQLLAASLRWAPPALPWQVQGAVVALDERGRLASDSAEVAWRGRHWGAWVDTRWQPADRWAVTLRLERAEARHSLDGTNAVLIAGEAGLQPNRPVERVGLALAHDWSAALRTSVEAGEERSAAASMLRWVALRLVWRPSFGPWTP
jgi:hypothetical protein